MSDTPPDRLAVAETHYWPMRYLAARTGVPVDDTDGLVNQAWKEMGASAASAEADERLANRAVGELLRQVQRLEAATVSQLDDAAVHPMWFNPGAHRWAGWWDREPVHFDTLGITDEATRSATEGALAELPLAPRAVIVLNDVIHWSPDAIRSLLGLDVGGYLAFLHAARSHVRRALERLVDDRLLVDESDVSPDPGVDLPDYEISCDRLTTLTTEYLDGIIPPRLRTTFEEHLIACPPCMDHVSQLRTTVRVLDALRQRAVPAEAIARLAAALSAA